MSRSKLSVPQKLRSFQICHPKDFSFILACPIANKDAQAYISCITDTTTVTLTVHSRDEASLAQSLSDNGLSVRSIGLRGRFHYPGNIKAVQQMKDLCSRDKRFQLPSAGHSALPLRSNSDAQLITRGVLHEIALDSILTEQAHWYETVKSTIAAIGGEKMSVMFVGAESILPRSLASEVNCEPSPHGPPYAKTIESPILQMEHTQICLTSRHFPQRHAQKANPEPRIQP